MLSLDKRYLKRTIRKAEIKSTHLGETRNIQVYLPPEHDESERYPVIYLQDGDDYFNMGRLATQANQLILDGETHPFAAVAIPVKKENRNAEYSPQGERHRSYLRFFAEELVPMVERDFPVSDRAGDRVLGGSSLGGTVSLHLALEYPDLFHRVLSQSGAFLEPTLEAIGRRNSLSGLKIYQTIGKSETAVPTHFGNLDLLARNREVHRALQEKEAEVVYSEQEGNHTWGFWQKDLPRALKTFFGKE
ncbi:enterochelin esterase-like enzyme [Melghirimyces profundicolus]|uniref:Enterochelin esterase-like enzyme n=1 Tax=Melghirimyces profundicolus TaxID=1242148 RepID=A0A2T6C7E9_9BACL|nr:alpha/beta hydrolase-fold protein [Melghirimyces profundicolus]PTX64225.1 enterochelin esterase-like enzyme [Melghirimyces profundicolus]